MGEASFELLDAMRCDGTYGRVKRKGEKQEDNLDEASAVSSPIPAEGEREEEVKGICR